jgi:hypothetical protein
MRGKKNNMTTIFQKAKEEINKKINEVIRENNIPACLIEGILMSAVADIREQEKMEMLENIKNMERELEKAKKATKRVLKTEPDKEQPEQYTQENPEE